MMRTLLLVMSLAALGCLTRTDLGAEPLPDAGSVADADTSPGGSDAGVDPERSATAMFEADLAGAWLAEDSGWTLQFEADSTYRSLDAEGNLRESGFFFVTDQLATRRYRAVLQDAKRQQTAELDQMWIDQADGKQVLRFETTRLGLVLEFELIEVR